MENQEQKTRDYYSIDILHIVKSLWQRAWMIALVCVIAGGLGFSYSAFAIAPTYSSSVRLYVNNKSSVSVGDFSLTTSQLTAAQSLVKTYGQILDSRLTYIDVVEKADLEGKYTWKEIAGMVSYAPANETEIIRVTVTCEDPYEACDIANAIAEVLPERVFDVMGGKMEIVDTAIPELNKVAPSITKYTAVAMILGFIGIVGVLTVFILMDDTIHDEDYVLRTYDYPILGKVPSLVNNGGGKSYSYYYQKKKHHRGDNEKPSKEAGV